MQEDRQGGEFLPQRFRHHIGAAVELIDIGALVAGDHFVNFAAAGAADEIQIDAFGSDRALAQRPDNFVRSAENR